MRLAEVKQRLVRIASAARQGDNDAATGDERQLFVDVLKAVAKGEAGAPEAAQALMSLELSFPRWTA